MLNSTELGFDPEAAYRAMASIRCAEAAILGLFEQGLVGGTTHTCIGQEANAVAVMGQLDRATDYVLSNHRNHGHYLAFGGDIRALVAEILGLPEGVCGGRGGSQHLKDGHFLSNGVQGGIAPIGVGLALGEKLAGTSGICVVCLGDGTLGEGVVYEALNMASLWSLPVLFLIEDNGYAQTTPVELGIAGSIVDRAAPFGIETAEIESTDARVLSGWAQDQIRAVRDNCRPRWAVIHTYRLAAHSKGDDTRDPDEVRARWSSDPLRVLAAEFSMGDRQRLDDEAEANLRAAIEDLLPEGAKIAKAAGVEPCG